VLEDRRRIAAETERLEDLVPLGSLYADLREFDEADRVYQRALRGYRGISPFAVAWVCCQLGVMWGELVPEKQSDRAASWYLKAIEFLPCYVKARVHLAEIYLERERPQDAEALLIPVISSDAPEVAWRLADVMVASGKTVEADAQMQLARSGFDILLRKHLLAFADHGAEFYSASGNDAGRAFELASANLANRPTIRAFELAYMTAVNAGLLKAATEILADAEERWGAMSFFCQSPLPVCRTEAAKNHARPCNDGTRTRIESSRTDRCLTR
jgi:tetratricopeptide (TPR) repeat protein